MIEDVFLVLLGLGFLYFGAEWAVKSSLLLASFWKVPPFIIGILLVSFGTSTPELFVTLQANLTEHATIAMANIVGSNLFNTAFTLGLCLCIQKATFSKKMQKVDLPFMGLSTLFLGSAYFFDPLGRIVGLFFLLCLIGYAWFQVYSCKEVLIHKSPSYEGKIKKNKTTYLLLILGIFLLLVGSHFFLEGAVSLAKHFHLSKAFIGLTLVAIGTSLPELATCLVAAFRGNCSIYLGNIVGANIYNVLGILGVSSLVRPIHFSGISLATFSFVTGVNMLLVFLAFFSPLGKKTGFFFLACYFASTFFL